MANIRIPGYKELIPNCVFGKSAESIEIKGKKYPTTFVTRIAKYKTCTPEQTLEVIRAAASEYCAMSEQQRKAEVAGIPPVSKFFMSFAEDEVKKIAIGDPESLRHLRQHYHATGLEPGRYYLITANGTIPNEIIRASKDDIEKLGFGAYERLLENKNAGAWHFRLRLNERDTLPLRSEIEYLIERGVESCFDFRVDGFEQDYSHFADYFRTLYSALERNNNLGKIADDSELFVKSRAALAIKETGECFQKQKHLEQLAEGMQGMLGNIIGMGVIGVPIHPEQKSKGGNGYGIKPSQN